jgi:23S rRNA (cytidine1920-2'-O)/16S rRNA (cytidine1409-2'-O)-methyltransferase
LIESGQILVGGSVADKASRLVAPAEAVVLAGPGPRFVGRGGEKLAAALERFGVAPSGRVALDAGASTGGFTDCLLQAGAARVVAVDVGRGQLHERLRADRRVEVHERTDIRRYAASPAGPFDLIVADLSFISIRSVGTALVALAGTPADLVILVKPQFEAGRVEVSRGRGVIRDPAIWKATLIGAISAMEAAGAASMGVMVSPLRGADGNVEFLTWFRTVPPGPQAQTMRGEPSRPVSMEVAVEAAVEHAALEVANAATRVARETEVEGKLKLRGN